MSTLLSLNLAYSYSHSLTLTTVIIICMARVYVAVSLLLTWLRGTNGWTLRRSHCTIIGHQSFHWTASRTITLQVALIVVAGGRQPDSLRTAQPAHKQYDMIVNKRGTINYYYTTSQCLCSPWQLQEWWQCDSDCSLPSAEAERRAATCSMMFDVVGWIYSRVLNERFRSSHILRDKQWHSY